MTTNKALPTSLFSLCLVPLCLGALTAGCFPEPCIDGLEANTRYRVTLLEPYDEDSELAAWDPDLGIEHKTCEVAVAPMATFEATTVDEQTATFAGGCTVWNLELHSFTGVDKITDREVRSGFLPTRYQPLANWTAFLEQDGCEGLWAMTLLAPDGGDPFAQLEASEPPPFLVERNLVHSIKSDEDCAVAQSRCYEYFVAAIEAVE